ncbi:MAG: tetratricopeptide repeat protein [Proteobacteria bacterium]|nr:tetratricopeptide repeat protein [Pseudomonadota bacterium]MBU1738407.1 tetratricopeptide repeat protein [Pseudomonadota bacterium]
MSPQRQLAHHRYALEMGFFETVILQGNRILKESETKSPADVALYALGETYAHHAFKGKDYGLSKYYFEKLVRNFPDSPLTWEAKTYLSLYEHFEVLKSEPKPIADEGPNPFSWTTATPDEQRFEKAIARNIDILEQSTEDSPTAAALYNLGLVYAHIDNPAKDFVKSRGYFEELIRKFPETSLAEEARVWTGLFLIIEKMQQIDMDIEQQKKQLNR